MTPAMMLEAIRGAIGDDRISPGFANEVEAWISRLSAHVSSWQSRAEYELGRADKADAEVERLREELGCLGSLEAMGADLKDGWKQRAKAAEAEVERLRRALVRVAALVERSDLGAAQALRIEALDHRPLKPAESPAADIDLDLLRKFATGIGGRRTGALMRAGLIEVRLTGAGRKALETP